VSGRHTTPDPSEGMIGPYNNSKSNIIKNRGKVLSAMGLDHEPKIRRLDLDRGWIKRYFTRKKNVSRGEIIEISHPQSLKLSHIPMFQIIEVEWRIRGRLEDTLPPEDLADKPIRLHTGLVTANRITVEEADVKMPGIKNKLKDPLQYYQGL
jgi:hypothetical protein